MMAEMRAHEDPDWTGILVSAEVDGVRVPWSEEQGGP